jgi:hypothetical protein
MKWLWLLLIPMLWGCENKEPHWERNCVDGYWYHIPMWVGKILILQPIHHCNQYDSTWVVPDTTRG